MASLTTISETDLTLYFVIRDQNALVWNTSTLALEAFSAGNYTLYAHTSLEQGDTGFYYGNTSASLPAGHYRIDWRIQAGGDPAQSDQPLAYGSAYWDGTIWRFDTSGGTIVSETTTITSE